MKLFPHLIYMEGTKLQLNGSQAAHDICSRVLKQSEVKMRDSLEVYIRNNITGTVVRL